MNLSLRRLYIVLGIILILRFAFLVIAVRNPSGGVLIDSEGYLYIANWIARHGNSVIPDRSDLIWPPGYPLFLRLLGVVDPGTLLPAYAVQLILSAGTAGLLVALGKIINKQRAGIFAAILYGLSPNTLFWSLTIMSEVLFAFWVTLSLYLVIRYQAVRKPSLIFFSGLSLGMGAMTRPIGLYLAPLWAIILIWFESRSNGTFRWDGLIRFILGMTIVILPWMTRNYLVRREFVFSNVATRTSANFNLAKVIAAAEGISRNEATLLVDNNSNQLVEGLRIFRVYPKEFIREQTAGVLRVVFGIESGVWSRVLIKENKRGQSFGILNLITKAQFSEAKSRIVSMLSEPTSRSLLLLGIWGIGYTLMLYLLGAVGVLSKNLLQGSLVWLTIFTILYLTIVPGAAGQARFRIPIEPLLALLSGYGIDSLASRIIPGSGYRFSRTKRKSQ